MMYSKNYVCITGASSGIGLETAKAFASLKNNLILVARRQERLEKLKEELGLIMLVLVIMIVWIIKTLIKSLKCFISISSP